MKRLFIVAALLLLTVAVGCSGVDGVIHVGSDPYEGDRNWDGDVDEVRYQKQRAQREAAASEAAKKSE